MTYVGTEFESRPVTQRELLLWLFLSGVSLTLVRYFCVGNAPLFWQNVNQVNVFLVGAFCVAAWRLKRFAGSDFLTKTDVTFAAGLVVVLVIAGLFPKLMGFGLFFLLFAFWLVRKKDPSHELHASAIVMFALVTNFLFAPVLFRMFLPFFVWLDAQLVGHTLQFLDPAFVWNTTSFSRNVGGTKFGVALVGACSSFNNVSAAVLVHMAWAMALRKHLTTFDGIALIGTVVIATLLNVLRIVLAALGPENYAFWHGPSGTMPLGLFLFVVAQNLALITAGYLTAKWAGRGRA
jgi:hypothetical protein